MPLDFAAAICASVGIAVDDAIIVPDIEPDMEEDGLGEPIVLCAFRAEPRVMEDTTVSAARDNLQQLTFMDLSFQTYRRLHGGRVLRPALSVLLKVYRTNRGHGMLSR
jgi:hypothetical protein